MLGKIHTSSYKHYSGKEELLTKPCYQGRWAALRRRIEAGALGLIGAPATAVANPVAEYRLELPAWLLVRRAAGVSCGVRTLKDPALEPLWQSSRRAG